MKRIGILTAGGDTPALNATIYGAVERANDLGLDVFGFLNGFAGILDPKMPHVHLNPLSTTIPELEPHRGGTLLGSSRTYVDPGKPDVVRAVADRLARLRIDGLICVGGDGTLNGMQPLAEFFPCVLAPKTIDNDLGLNYPDEPNEWIRDETAGDGILRYRQQILHEVVRLEEIVNYATPGYATAVFVATDAIRRIRTTAESHRRIAIVEVMGRDSGYIALGCAYGQPDVILLPEMPLDLSRITTRVRELYELQEHAVVVIGEGVVDETGRRLGAVAQSVDPAGKVVYRGAAEELKRRLTTLLGESFFSKRLPHESRDSIIFTRKVGHTQRGGRPIRFDRFYATQLGGKAVELLAEGRNNSVVTLQWSPKRGFCVDSVPVNKLRD
ncbi:MAG TPA: 6-phosphofructokinase, partial [Planctomycetaceae bacterium]|nr:6-phosphofructokinase [Planctomycetaceae bacterium]